MNVAPRTITVAALELPARYGEPDVVLGEVDALLAARGAGVDLALLPETALTGYVSPAGDFDLARFAEPLEGPTASRLAEIAARRGVALAAPLVEYAGGRLYNSLVLFDREGARAGHWRKRHPWYPETWATPGDLGTPVVTVAGARVTAGICFDVHFVAEDAPDALREADVFLFPAAWTERPPDSRAGILGDIARAFGTAVVHANWGPGSPRVHGQGGSRVLDASGACVARARAGGAAGGQVVRADVRVGP